MKACLDTHAVIWSLMDDLRLGRHARRLISASSKADLIVPDVVLLETAMLIAKGRVRVTCGPEKLLARIEGCFHVLAIDSRIAHLALALDIPHSDSFDRVITATAKVHGIPLLTRDRIITDSRVVGIVW